MLAKKNNKLINLSYILVILTSFIISLIFYKHQKVGFAYAANGSGDSVGYLNISKKLFIVGPGEIRTYGYPLFLYLYNFFIPLKKTFASSVLILQFTLYALSSVCISRALTKNENFRLFITASLLLNIYILSYLSVTLTEALSLSLLLILLAMFFGLKESKLRTFLLGLVSAFSVEVRPANLWLFGLISILFLLERAENDTLKDIFISLVIFSIAALIAFFPQVYYNYHVYNKLTPFPAFGLGSSQYEWGKQAVHTSFSFLPIATSNVMPNPFMTSSLHDFQWFSLNGLSYLLLKILLIFSHNTLFVYQNISELHQKLLIFLSSFTVYFGFLGIFFQSKKIELRKLHAIWIGLFLCILLHIFSGLEDRFTFAVYLLLFPFAIYQFVIFFKTKRYKLFLLFIFFFLFMNLMNAICHALTPSYVQSVLAGHIL